MKVKKTKKCWIWTAGTRGNGYGTLKLNRKSIDAHRVSWMLTNGIIPDGVWVLHHCDNRLCVRPDHLFLGTPRDNVIDMMKKGREKMPGNFKKGVPNIRRKLSEEIVRLIRKEYIETLTSYSKLAKKYNIAKTPIANLLRHESYVEIK